MNEQETIVDIIAEKRREADYIEETARGSLKAGENYDGIAYTESDLESALGWCSLHQVHCVHTRGQRYVQPRDLRRTRKHGNRRMEQEG